MLDRTATPGSVAILLYSINILIYQLNTILILISFKPIAGFAKDLPGHGRRDRPQPFDIAIWR